MAIRKKPTASEIKRRTILLNKLVSEHGLVKVAHAAMASLEGIRQCASKTAPRYIADETLQLGLYRLADKEVWKSRDWIKLEAAEVRKIKAAERAAGAKARAAEKLAMTKAKVVARTKAIAAKKPAVKKTPVKKTAVKKTPVKKSVPTITPPAM